MVYTLVLEASAERIESSSLSLRTTFWGYSSSGRAVALQAIGGRFESCYLHQFNNTQRTVGWHSVSPPAWDASGKHNWLMLCLCYLILEIIMKTRKPRNHVQLALMKRGGAGSHKKSHKQLRGQWKRNMDV